MANMRRHANDTPQEYFYKMQAIGNKAGMSEEDIAHHIINGITTRIYEKLYLEIIKNVLICYGILTRTAYIIL